MERHRCKLCFRNFANGRALGGHMRSHMMNLYAAKNSSKKQVEEEVEQVQSHENFQETDELQSVHSYSSSSSDEEDEGEEEEEEEENPKKRPFFVDQEFSVVLQDGESETESSKANPFCRRSKRVRKSRISYSDKFPPNEFSRSVKKFKFGETSNEHSPLSSISDTTPDEDVAYCLMMLSRDRWKKGNDYNSEDSGDVKVKKTEVRGKYSCETCSKFFRSYQALGGHMASHRKIKVIEAAPTVGGGPVVEETAALVEEKIHECPFCHRVFASGQALGGHKRSHFTGASANVSTSTPVKQFSRNGDNLDIDLNLPAPSDDDEISH